MYEKKVLITSYNQSGGITAHTVNINKAPEPRVNGHFVFENQLQNGEYLTRIALVVESPYPPGNLFITVYATSIKRIRLVPQHPGIVIMGHCGNRDGMSFTNLQNPFGLIHLEVFTGTPERLGVEWDVQ